MVVVVPMLPCGGGLRADTCFPALLGPSLDALNMRLTHEGVFPAPGTESPGLKERLRVSAQL